MNATVFPSLVQDASAVPQAKNIELGKLIRTAYTLDDLEAIRKALVANKTLFLRRYSSGGHSAVTVVEGDDRTLEAAIDGLLMFHWDRDNIMQTLAELSLAEDPAMNAGLAVPADAWRRGLMASLIHHKKREFRFMDLITDRASGLPHDYMRRPHIRYNPISLEEVGDPWGHGQNDSLSFINFMTFYTLNTGRLSLSDSNTADLVNSFGALLHAFFWKVNVWQDRDLGAWEDCVGVHWSSVACALVSLREQLTYMERNGGSYVCVREGQELRVDTKGLRELIEKCEAKLRELGTNEFVEASGYVRTADLAQINPMLLAAFSGKPVLDDANTVAVLESIERTLMSPIGVRRYLQDRWDGRINRDDLAAGEEAQWCHGSPQMSYIWGDLYLRTGEERYFEKQVFHFNRALASVSPRWLMPEAWIIDQQSRQWVPDANEPLAWAQSMLALSLVQMKASLTKRAASGR